MYRIRIHERLITSLLDNDLYKFTMGLTVYHRHPDVWAGYSFFNRGGTSFPEGFGEELRNQVDMLADLCFTEAELEFIKRKCGHFIPIQYIDDFLRHFRLNPKFVTIRQRGGKLTVKVDGPWHLVIYWEVILLALISELYYRLTEQFPEDGYLDKAFEKARKLQENNVPFSNFGMRRRHSVIVERGTTKALAAGGGQYFYGTSNLLFAFEEDLTPMGTMAHEWYMGNAGLYGTRSATREGLKAWAEEFEGYLGFTLTDTFTTQKFFEDFTPYYMKLFDGCRQDSGDPLRFVDMFLAHYRAHKVNPLTKQIVFSDSLDVDRAIAINEYCKGKIFQALFGIGTHFTNDVGVKPLNIVIKLDYVIRPEEPNRRIYVVKFSDTPEKVTGNKQAVRFNRYDLGLAS